MRLWRRRRPRSLSDVIAANLRRPDPTPAPPVDLLQILMGCPD
jgi:hypothetical protein